MNWLFSLALSSVLLLQPWLSGPVHMAPEDQPEIRELNFVFLHGMGGNPCTLQELSDKMLELLPIYENEYGSNHPGTQIKVNILSRCFPGYADIDTWAGNIADAINTHFKGKDNLILVGHSMGGKTALYTVAHDVGHIADRVEMVVTINSPIRKMSQYYVPGGGPMLDYCRTTLLGSDEGVCTSLANYDSSEDGAIISRDKHWLAFVSAEPAPLSPDFDRTGVDTFPRNMDDGIVPLPVQFTEDADVYYYGHYAHSDVGLLNEPKRIIAEQLLNYIFGRYIYFSVLKSSGTIEHEADWLLGTDVWRDVVGGNVSAHGVLENKNKSLLQWWEFENIIGEYSIGKRRAYAEVELLSPPLVTDIKSAAWVAPDDESDMRLKVRMSAAPKTTVSVNWTIYEADILSPEHERTFYDIEMTAGTPLAGVFYADWIRDTPDDPSLSIWSQAQSPFRWLEAEWRIYQKDKRWRNVIDEIYPPQTEN